ncbi:hypothetical protein CMUST_05515 [Corynebacterium mustelae]|uniref:Secreted protein n=1 Tax=Corynebacterium mustelae TaxID=571915 RepID=A0A0G3GW97_9CORY|nr:hypothetical protein [Corynebacterium mustelae]AKK05439.1 hypothetical protein CMUST_05515 [Corynebacterium mustelae]
MTTSVSGSSLRRHVAGAMTLFLSATLVASCTPPSHQDSTKKVDTATESPMKPDSYLKNLAKAAIATTPPMKNEPGVIDCIGPAQVKPTALHITCLDDADFVTHLVWEKWDKKEAAASGLRVSQTTKKKKKVTTYSAVKITLADPTETPSGVVFTTIEVDDEPITGVPDLAAPKS